MSKKKKKEKAKIQVNNKKQKKSFWQNKTNQLLIKFIAIMLLFYIIWPTPFFQNYVVSPISFLYAQISGVLLSLVGYNVNAIKNSLVNPNFAINIQNGCDGIEGLAIFFAGILIFPTSINNKLKGVLFGALFLVVLNIFRIITLFLFKVHAPSLFDFMHVTVWQVLFIGLTLFALFYWINWTNNQQQINTNA